MPKPYQHAALGGTFDRLHQGHQHLLDTAFKHAQQVTIGVTQPDLTHTKEWSSLITPYDQRLADLKHYLKHKEYQSRARLIPLTDIYGTTITDPSIDLIVVSPQTVAGAEKVNQERQRRQLPPLPVKVSAMIKDKSGEYLSSTRIRQGLVNRAGEVYSLLFQDDLILTDKQKNQLKSPQGKLFSSLDLIPPQLLSISPRLIAIGDMVTRELVLRHIPYHLGVIDGYIQRQSVGRDAAPNTVLKQSHNPAGMITAESATIIHEVLQHSVPTTLLIDGEEDLLGFPAALTAPLGSVLLYGQPFQGIVAMELTEAKKEQLAAFLDPTFTSTIAST